MDKNSIIENVAAILVVTINSRKICFDIQNIFTTLNSKQAIIKSYSDNSSFIEIEKHTIPLVNFSGYFNLINKENGIDSRIIVIELNNMKFAFYVDKINEIIRFDERKKSKIKFILEKEVSSYSAGVLVFADEYIYPDLPKLIRDIHNQNTFNLEQDSLFNF
jgi:chemotaxis signal transduction protein